MVYYMPGETVSPPDAEQDQRAPRELTPREIVEQLDRFIIGQAQAKRAVAIALRNRYRRQRLPPEMAEEVAPKNIIMIGPTGVGKTEVARRLARLARSPFMKVEATKFTEVGYVGRDVESMVRDLMEIAIDLVRQEQVARVRDKAAANVEERLLNLLLPPRQAAPAAPVAAGSGAADAATRAVEREAREQLERTRDTLRRDLSAGTLDDRMVEIQVQAGSRAMPMQVFSPQGLEEISLNLKDMIPGLFGGGKPRRRRMTVREARDFLL